MIRAVPVEYFTDPDKSGPDHMAFLDTVTDQFLMFDGTHVWDCWPDLEIDIQGTLSEHEGKAFIKRLRGLSPQWFLEKK